MHCFDFPLIWQFECTVSPPETHLARWHELCVGISRLSFPADGWQSCPNAAEVVILVSNTCFWFMTIIFSPSGSSDLPDSDVWNVLCHSVNSPDKHSKNWQKKCFRLIVSLVLIHLRADFLKIYSTIIFLKNQKFISTCYKGTRVIFLVFHW